MVLGGSDHFFYTCAAQLMLKKPDFSGDEFTFIPFHYKNKMYPSDPPSPTFGSVQVRVLPVVSRQLALVLYFQVSLEKKIKPRIRVPAGFRTQLLLNLGSEKSDPQKPAKLQGLIQS